MLSLQAAARAVEACGKRWMPRRANEKACARRVPRDPSRPPGDAMAPRHPLVAPSQLLGESHQIHIRGCGWEMVRSGWELLLPACTGGSPCIWDQGPHAIFLSAASRVFGSAVADAKASSSPQLANAIVFWCRAPGFDCPGGQVCQHLLLLLLYYYYCYTLGCWPGLRGESPVIT
jgi:hypothetical protein